MKLEMFFDKAPDYLPEKYREDYLFRALATKLFSHQLSLISDFEQPGAIKVGEIDVKTNDALSGCIDRNWWFEENPEESADRVLNYKSAEQTENIVIISKENKNYDADKYTAFAKANYDRLRPIVDYSHEFARNVGGGELRSLVLVRLGPRKKVDRHFDRDVKCLVRDRYHVVLKCVKQKQLFGNRGSEEYSFKENEIWWYNNKIIHQAENQSDEERVHLMMDVVPFKNLNFEALLMNSKFNPREFVQQ